MPVHTLRLDGRWWLRDVDPDTDPKRVLRQNPEGGAWMPARVPGDIHPDLVRAGRIPDPFIGDNVERCAWTTQREWWFRRIFRAPKRLCDRAHVDIVFEGIDTFGAVWVNGERVGETRNMFRPYRFGIRHLIHAGQPNEVVVRVGATTPIIERTPWQGYFACFYTPRIFARKAQCHFSWDWAPHLPALGIWRGVRLEAWDTGRIVDAFVRPANSGEILLQIQLDERPVRPDEDSQELSDTGERGMRRPQGTYRIDIEGPGTRLEREAAVQGQKSFVNLRVPRPRLWWPNGLGNQPLYRYRIRLVRDGRTRDTVDGTFGFREVELEELPLAQDTLSFSFRVNGRKTFCKGANWVPPDCFPGTVSPARYERLLLLAREANFNMLRVWGGGIYEHDAFYDLCDRLGLMIWQDFMFACSDYPDEHPDFVDNVIGEAEHQVRRLRNHPSVVCWCGGNEKTGSAGFKVSHGERLFHVILPGITRDLDPTRPYRPASPHSLTDLGNDRGSGDTHASAYEDAFVDDARKFRDHVRRIRTVFNSEFGANGPLRWQSLRRFIPENHLWPPDAVWELHVQDNPYNTLPETFVEVQMKIAERLFGPLQGVRDFLKKGMTAHAEILREEFENHRRRKFANSGAMFWMFDDTWPCGSWAAVDYYGLPKAVYYAARRACAPVLLSFAREERDDRSAELRLVNDLPRDLRLSVSYGIETVDGRTLLRKTREMTVPDNGNERVGVVRLPSPFPADAYLFAGVGGRPDLQATWFPNLWHDVPWPEPEIVVRPAGPARHSGDAWIRDVRVRALRYARCLNLNLPHDEENLYSDNFFDLRPGSSRRIRITSPREIDVERLVAAHWLDEWT